MSIKKPNSSGMKMDPKPNTRAVKIHFPDSLPDNKFLLLCVWRYNLLDMLIYWASGYHSRWDIGQESIGVTFETFLGGLAVVLGFWISTI